MRSVPDSKYDKEELKKLKAEPWQVKLLSLNPSYTCWGPGEDYMPSAQKGSGNGWNSSVEIDSWKNFTWELDELNELVNFYFQVTRDSRPCDSCDSSGHNPKTKRIADDFYDFSETGRRWCDRITQDEVEALQAANRLRVSGPCGWVKKEGLTAEEVNAANRRGGSGLGGNFGHDAINRWILIETRAKRLGVYGKCQECGGEGHIYTAEKATVSLILWMIHPRKGAARGIEVKLVEKDDLKSVFAYLKKAADRNAERFAKAVERAA